MLRGRSLLTLKDFSRKEIESLLTLAHRVKKRRPNWRFAGKSLAILFEKRSTRTRCSFETAFGEEGGHPVFLSWQDIHAGAKETIEDTARVLGRMFDAIAFRGSLQQTVEALASASGVPVYNGLTDAFHPTQALADIMTLQEEFKHLEGKKIAYIGDGRNNVANSILLAASKMGIDITIVTPQELSPDEGLLDLCRAEGARTGADIAVSYDVGDGVAGADAIYTDVWISMGEEEKERRRLTLLRPYQVNDRLFDLTGKSDTIFLHCLPAVRGNEVTAEVIDGDRSRVWNQAENRKHTIKALVLATL
jgi:ornithine carbamoyltransferase